MFKENIEKIFKKYCPIHMKKEDFTAFKKENTKVFFKKLNNLGVPIASISHLRNAFPEQEKTLPLALDFFIETLEENDSLHPRVISCIVSCLRHQSIVKTKDLFNYLFECYLVTPPSDSLENKNCRGVDNSLANALIAHYKPKHLDKLITLVNKKELGPTRVLLLTVFDKKKNRKDPKAREFLLSLANKNDPEFEYTLKKPLKGLEKDIS